MRRHIPGLHSREQNHDRPLEGFFLVRVDQASYRWHPQKPFLALRFVVLEPRVRCHTNFLGPALLHRTGPLETELVSARFRV